MAIGTLSNFTIYDEEFWTGVTETLQQNANVFNDASRNALRLATNFKLGQFEKSTFIEEIANGGIGRRDPSSVAEAEDTPTVQREQIGVKLNRRFQFADTIDKWKKIGDDPATFSLLVGQQYGVGILVEQCNTIIRALTAAMGGNAGVVHDGTGGPIGHSGLAKAMYKFGDRADRVVCWAMHSAAARDLLVGSIENQTNNFQVAGLAVLQGSIATLGKPVVVSDSPSLLSNGSIRVLGLTENAGVIELSEDRTVVLQTVLGLQNIVLRLQGEYAYNVKIKGYSWGDAANPDDVDLADSDHWDKVASDNKTTAGVMLLCDEDEYES